jgi:16S rRNA (cytidine1402-2'-O)-methyltransferase
VLPGAAAFVCAAVLSGFDLRRFVFAGFPPRTGAARRAAFRAALAETTVWYEAPHRIRAALDDLAQVAPERRVFLVRELTKRFEQQIAGHAADIAAALADPVRGEFVFVVEGAGDAAPPAAEIDADALDAAIDRLAGEGLSASAIAKQLAEAGCGERRHIYARVAARRKTPA